VIYLPAPSGDTTQNGGPHGRAAGNHQPQPPTPVHHRPRQRAKGAKVELLGTPDNKPLAALKPSDQVWVRQFSYFTQPGTQLREANIAWRNLDRAYRTKEEQELGRDFTDEEAAEYERVLRLKVAEHQADYRAKSINDRLAQMAERLERAAEDMRRLVANEGYRLDQKVYQAQHDLA